jgi:hypothetical protein
MLTLLFENKYVGMAQDRFASLPPLTQKRILMGLVLSVFSAVGVYLTINYIELWQLNTRAKEASALSTVLIRYQKTLQDKASELREVEGGSNLNNPGMLKQRLLDLGRFAGIAPKLIQTDEQGVLTVPTTGEKTGSERKFQKATVTLEKVTLPQIIKYINSVESSRDALSISGLRIYSDEKLRGYMGLNLEIHAQIFNREVP